MYERNHNGVRRADAWTRRIICKVHYHPAIGDAIDIDTSGFISIDEMNEFLREKPARWTIPEWIAYWAYGWDSGNAEHSKLISKAFGRLKELASAEDIDGRSVLINHYCNIVRERILTVANSTYPLDEIESSAIPKMLKLRKEWADLIEAKIKAGLKTVHFELHEGNVSAVTGSEREEERILPIVSILLSRHVKIMAGSDVTEEVVHTLIETMKVLIHIIGHRIRELRTIWRKQRMDVDVQFRYYANGLLFDYYRKFMKEQFEFEDNQYGVVSPWVSDDEWDSDDGEHDQGSFSSSLFSDKTAVSDESDVYVDAKEGKW